MTHCSCIHLRNLLRLVFVPRFVAVCSHILTAFIQGVLSRPHSHSHSSHSYAQTVDCVRGLGRGRVGGKVTMWGRGPRTQIKARGRPTPVLCVPELGKLNSWTVVEEPAVVSFPSWLLFKQRFPCTHGLGRVPCTSTGGWHATRWWLVCGFFVYLLILGPYNWIRWFYSMNKSTNSSNSRFVVLVR